MTEPPLKWGILGTGWIAQRFTEDLLLLPGHTVSAVGSRVRETAETFARQYGAERAWGSYEQLVADDGIDVVYVATPHTFHFAHASLALEAGRAVLVEKPFTANAADARRLVELARERGLFAMEAMWTRFNPLIARLRGLVADGAIGDVTAVYADFGTSAPYDPAHRLWSPELGGGALLDLGVYPLYFASMLLGAPETIQATAATAPTGVDANTGIVLGYASGAVAVLHCSLTADSPCTAVVNGTKGRIEVASPFYSPHTLVLRREGAEPETFRLDVLGNGYGYQAEEVARRLRAGETESPVMPLDETLALHGDLHTILARIERQAVIPSPTPV
ncbi:Gfo/Idh/MocA family oxidoreductase [Streptomyces misionensis]|uniref:Gfo/Idh/MocA family oxidoreductase n=1 Tax=Streptomyces misionensis TaxID=67331 RepID=A0A5C6JVI7_9ACTN|nr:Gfo/Idh/MocA family oxidoreductase [Streptomyces misionensis]TWV51999.1 Gfo/Idh/MocA family oxidoreductase [Streptomyces misionensis]